MPNNTAKEMIVRFKSLPNDLPHVKFLNIWMTEFVMLMAKY